MKLILRQWFNEAFKSILKFKLLLKKHFSFSLKKKKFLMGLFNNAP